MRPGGFALGGHSRKCPPMTFFKLNDYHYRLPQWRIFRHPKKVDYLSICYNYTHIIKTNLSATAKTKIKNNDLITKKYKIILKKKENRSSFLFFFLYLMYSLTRSFAPVFSAIARHLSMFTPSTATTLIIVSIPAFTHSAVNSSMAANACSP
mgnify:CR=1 FL=1